MTEAWRSAKLLSLWRAWKASDQSVFTPVSDFAVSQVRLSVKFLNIRYLRDVSQGVTFPVAYTCIPQSLSPMARDPSAQDRIGNGGDQP